MIVLKIGDDAEFWLQPQKHIVVLVRLNHEVHAFAVVSIGGKRLDFRAKNETRIEAERIEQGDQQGSCGGFAVRTGNCQGLFA